MKPRIICIAAVAVLIAATGTMSWTSLGSVAYNSEEHKLIADRGAAAVKLPAGMTFPADLVTLGPVTADAYLTDIRHAKKLAVGYETNGDHWDTSTEHIQDNCYFTGLTKLTNSFGQGDYNTKIWIPIPADAPSMVLHVAGYASSKGVARPFTFGELVAFYGDYRQAPYCEGGNCYLTNGDIGDVRFVAQGGTRDKFCPAPIKATQYIARIGSGVVPPFGAAGNATGNTAEKGAGDYGDAGWWGDEMLRVANVNDWHFSNTAVAWYVGMHRLALIYADSARTRPEYWVKALHYEANGLHSLTDLFAFGHVVTNGDEASYNIIRNSGVENKPLYQWMKSVITLGGGTRDVGKVFVKGELPALTASAPPRNTLQEVSATKDMNGHKLAEKFYHDSFNAGGGTVRNLRGDVFRIRGDGELSWMARNAPEALTAATGAVTASLQSLVDGVDAISKGSTTAAQLSTQPEFFAALQFLPVFIVNDEYGYFTGRWTLYASAINELTGAKRDIDLNCLIPRISGTSKTFSNAEWVKIVANRGLTRDMLAWPAQQPPRGCTAFR